MNKKEQDDFQVQMNKMGDEIEKSVNLGMKRLGNELESASGRIQAAWKQTQIQMQREKEEKTVSRNVTFGANKRKLIKKAKSNRRWAKFWGFLCFAGVLSIMNDVFVERAFQDIPSTMCSIGIFLFASIKVGYNAYLYRKASEYFEWMQGKQECDVKTLADYTNTAEKTVVAELKAIKNRNWIKPLFFSADKQVVYANMSAVQKTFAVGQMSAAKPPQQVAAPPKNSSPKQDYLQQINELSQNIENTQVYEKVQKIQELAQNIFEKAEQTETPPANLKKFETYYLPTTIKLLKAYTEVDDEPIEGMNVEKIRQDIPELLDTLIEAYQNLLDSFYANVAMNISSEITVLRDMLAQEGLVADKNMILPQTENSAMQQQTEKMDTPKAESKS